LVVTGLPGSGKSLWLKRWLDKMAVDMPGARCAVLIAGEGNTRLDPAAHAAGHDTALPSAGLPVLHGLWDFDRSSKGAWRIRFD
jgi:hypothetical protein